MKRRLTLAAAHTSPDTDSDLCDSTRGTADLPGVCLHTAHHDPSVDRRTDGPHVLLVSAVAYRLTGQYAIHRFRRLREEFASVLRGVALMGLFVVATTFSLQDRYDSRATFLIFFLLAMLLILLGRKKRPLIGYARD